jgi:hypothetical protein
LATNYTNTTKKWRKNFAGSLRNGLPRITPISTDWLPSPKNKLLSYSSPPWRGERSYLFALGNWGGLLNSEPNDEECDATDDAQGTEAGNKKSVFICVHLYTKKSLVAFV